MAQGSVGSEKKYIVQRRGSSHEGWLEEGLARDGFERRGM